MFVTYNKGCKITFFIMLFILTSSSVSFRSSTIFSRLINCSNKVFLTFSLIFSCFGVAGVEVDSGLILIIFCGTCLSLLAGVNVFIVVCIVFILIGVVGVVGFEIGRGWIIFVLFGDGDIDLVIIFSSVT